MRFKTWLLAAALTCLITATAVAHPLDQHELTQAEAQLLHLGSGGDPFAPLGAPGTATSPLGRGINQTAPAGPCTEAAKAGMPQGDNHDHSKVEHHRNLRCRIDQVAFLPLKDELAARPNVVLGEMDVKADIAAVSVIFPEGGLLFFDVKDPANPKFLSWYRSSQCEGAAIANNCGAFVDLSADGKTAFIAQQSLTFVPGANAPSPSTLPTTTPGVEVVDIKDPRKPARRQVLPVRSEGGVHTARTHVIPATGSAPREPGEYVFGIANRQASDQNSGIDISKFNPTAGNALVPYSRIDIGETHDTFIQNDPYDGRTYLYIAGGYSKGLEVYDITAPSAPKKVASWNLTPECPRDWYSHTVDVTHRNGKRIVTMPAEIFDGGASTAAEKAAGCGDVRGGADQPGPMWIIDATDFKKLGQVGEANDVVKRKSEQALIATWTNPAGRASGDLTFSPHNQQIVGDRIYLSDYHGGVFVLDASGAFAGRSERPRELGYIVPSGEASTAAARPAAGAQSPAPTAAPRTRGRSSIWDMVFYKGYIVAADQIGGFYSLRYDESESGTPSQVTPPRVPTGGGSTRGGAGSGAAEDCGDRVPPSSSILRRGARLNRRGATLTGSSADLGCRARVTHVRVSIAREAGRQCRFLKADGRFTPARSCRRTSYLSARGTTTWRLRTKARLAPGRYKVWVRAIDAAGNVERKDTATNFKRLRVR